MNVNKQQIRNPNRVSQTLAKVVSTAGSADETPEYLSESVRKLGNGALLKSLDTNARRNAFAGHGDSAQGDTSQSPEATAPASTGDNVVQLGTAAEARIAVINSIVTDSTGEIATESAIANDTSGVESVKSAMQNNFSELASDPKRFHEVMKQSFGEGYNKAKAETIRQQVLASDFSWMPEIKVVDQSVLQDTSGTQGAGEGSGAYSKSTDTIYLSAQLLASDPDKATKILAEEVGHGLDVRLNVSDTAGDEGNVFARLLDGEKISKSDLAALQIENDSGVILVDGEEVEVEFFFKKLYKKAKKAVKKITAPIVKIAKKVAAPIVKIAKKVVDVTVKSVKKVGKVISDHVQSVRDVASNAWKSVKKAAKKVMESKLFNQILMVAQFIPIPMVQLVVRVINVAKAAYSVYQGVKHGSIAMVLGGVAGVAGGASSLGSMLGASAKFVNAAAKVATVAGNSAAAYSVLAEGDFSAAASLASNYFGGKETNLGKNLSTLSSAATTVDRAKDGDILGAVVSGREVYQGLITPGVQQAEAPAAAEKIATGDEGEVLESTASTDGAAAGRAESAPVDGSGGTREVVANTSTGLSERSSDVPVTENSSPLESESSVPTENYRIGPAGPVMAEQTAGVGSLDAANRAALPEVSLPEQQVEPGTEIKRGGALYENEDLGLTIGRAEQTYTVPHFDANSEELKISAGASYGEDVTILEWGNDVELNSLASAEYNYTVGTTNVEIGYSIEGQLQGIIPEGTMEYYGGAEAMAFNGEIGGTLTITPNTLADTINDTLDWVVKPFNVDVPDIPDLPGIGDHGLVVGLTAEAGIGIAAKASFGFDVKLGERPTKANVKFKIGSGIVVGGGATLGVK